MKELKKNENKKNIIFNIFIMLYIISFIDFYDLNVIRYLILVVVQIYCIIQSIKQKILLNTKKIFLILILIVSMLISFFNSKYFIESTFKLLTVIDLLLISYIFLPNLLKNYNVDIIVENIVNDLFIVLGISYILFYNDYVISNDSNRVGNLIRLSSGFNHPNTLGMFSFLGVVFSSYFIFNKKQIKKYSLYSIVFVFLLIKSGSRTALYTMIIFVLLYIINRFPNSKRKKIILYIICIAIIIVSFILSDYNYQKIDFDVINTILSYRLTYIQNALEVLSINDAILTGMGPFRNSMITETNSVMIDNGYFNHIYQFGVISFIFLVIFLIDNFKTIKNKKNLEKDKIFIKNLYITFLIYAFFENILFNISSLYAIIIFTLINLCNEEKK